MGRATTTIFSSYKRDLILKAESGIEEILQSIQQGHYSLQIEAARAAAGTDQYEAYKAIIPAFSLESLSGLIYAESPGQDLETLKTIPSLHSAWLKPSGNGYALLFRIEDCEPNQVSGLLKEYEQEYHVSLINPKQTTVIISSDPEVWVNDNVKPHWNFPSFTNLSQEFEIGEDFEIIIKQPSPNQEPQAIIEAEVIQLPQLTEQPAQEPKKKRSRYEHVFAQNLKQVYAQPVDFDGKKYVIYDEPQQIIDMYRCKNIPVKKHEYVARIIMQKKIVINASEGKPHKTENLCFIGDGDISCVSSVSEKQLVTIYLEELEKFKKGEMTVQTVTRKGKINPALSRKEKETARGEMTGKIRRDKTASELEAIILQLQAEGKKTTTKAISLLSGISTATVDRYRYKELKHLFNKKETPLKKAA